MVVYNKFPFFGVPGSRVPLALRAAAGTFSVTVFFFSLSMIPLGDSSTIRFTDPVFVAIFAYVFLKEPLTLFHGITGLITLSGVVIISKPTFIFGADNNDTSGEERVLGSFLALLGAISAAYAVINLRKLRTTPAPVIVMWFGITIVVSGCIILGVLNKFAISHSWTAWGLMIFSGLCACGAQFFLTIALR